MSVRLSAIEFCDPRLLADSEPKDPRLEPLDMDVVLKDNLQRKVNVFIKRGTWWLSGKFGALRPEGRRFKSHSTRHA